MYLPESTLEVDSGQLKPSVFVTITNCLLTLPNKALHLTLWAWGLCGLGVR